MNIQVRCAKLLIALVLVVCASAQTRADFPPSQLAKGIQQVRDKAYSQAVSTLSAVPRQLPQLADYAAYYLGVAQSELKQYEAAVASLSITFRHQPLSPLASRAVLLAASNLNELGRPKEAISLLKQNYKILPVAGAESALARSFELADDSVSAAVSWQRVHYYSPASEFADEAARALTRLRSQLGDKFPPAMSQAIMARAKGLADARRYSEAKRELESGLSIVAGPERDLAKVRIGLMDYQLKNLLPAFKYLKALEVSNPEADAERLYHLAYVAKRLDREDEMQGYLREIGQKYPQSPWRLEALLTASYLYLGRNEPAGYEPLYQACSGAFPNNPQAAGCDWRLVWSNYLKQPTSGESLFKSHLQRFPGTEKTPASLYFLARQYEMQRNYSAARVYYQYLTQYAPNHFYATLAQERLGAPTISKSASSPEAQSFLNSITFPKRSISLNFVQNKATAMRLERARLLWSATLQDLAEAELRFAARNDGQPHLIAMELARLLNKREAYDEALFALKAYVPDYLNIPFDQAPMDFWRVAFPLPYRDAVERFAKEKDLDPFLVAGLIRQESAFNRKAVSIAHAYGLTQVLPSTGRWLSQRNGIPRFTTASLFEPNVNLRLGTIYLRQLLDSFQSKWEHVLAAYNGGPTRVNRWMTWHNFREPAEFIETIPLLETRDYVQIVMRNANVYRRLYGQQSAAVPSQKNGNNLSSGDGQ